jgi:hypothetical protein
MLSTLTRSALLGGLTGIAMLAAGSAFAAPISFSDTAFQTSDGQAFSFSFTDMDLSDGPGTLTISGSGDYNALNEWFSLISMDGNPIATNFHPTITGFNGSNDVDISATFTISSGMMAAMTADGEMTIIIDLAAGVSASQPDDPFVAMTLSYEPHVEQIQTVTAPPSQPPYTPPYSHIAEPATLALFGLGLAGIGFARRRKTA